MYDDGLYTLSDVLGILVIFLLSAGVSLILLLLLG